MVDYIVVDSPRELMEKGYVNEHGNSVSYKKAVDLYMSYKNSNSVKDVTLTFDNMDTNKFYVMVKRK